MKSIGIWSLSLRCRIAPLSNWTSCMCLRRVTRKARVSKWRIVQWNNSWWLGAVVRAASANASKLGRRSSQIRAQLHLSWLQSLRAAVSNQSHLLKPQRSLFLWLEARGPSQLRQCQTLFNSPNKWLSFVLRMTRRREPRRPLTESYSSTTTSESLIGATYTKCKRCRIRRRAMVNRPKRYFRRCCIHRDPARLSWMTWRLTKTR